MNLTYVDVKSLKTLEDYSVVLVSAIISVKTLSEYHVRAMEIGILPDDMQTRCTTILWDMARMINLHNEQLQNVLELLPDNFTTDNIIDALKQQHIKKARSITRKPKAKE